MRIGHGYDVHRFCDNRPLFLGGVNIPYEKGLLGHSDADVLLHAICDALIGACALGDIGHLFPDNNDKYKDIDSKILLSDVVSRLEEIGYKTVNVDATVIAQKPKLAPYISKMRETVAELLKTDIANVNIKATTEEGLGFTGELLGISAHAVCLIG
ncbi:MAG: 2-C-methyl-D-erythritol 2,4-cyclodiphosphate synthase [Ruminococcaceae bacterium]|nr:2-C-methyl-D-erythritol 2,4-cyclodiphosphate synthase [Oscillospiraceae bacterium]